NLVDKALRDRQSHEVALALREPLAAVGRRHGASVKVVEVPPGPPVQAPLVAEVYGPDYAGQLNLARELGELFAATPDIVDVDTSVETDAPRLVVRLDRSKAALLGVTQRSVANAFAAALGGADVTYLHDEHAKYPIPVRLELPVADQAELDGLLALRVAAAGGRLVPLAEIVDVETAPWEKTIYHKDLLPVAYVTADMAGDLGSPLYGMLDLADRIDDVSFRGQPVEQRYVGQPERTTRYAVKWDGEWQVTFDT